MCMWRAHVSGRPAVLDWQPWKLDMQEGISGKEPTDVRAPPQDIYMVYISIQISLAEEDIHVIPVEGGWLTVQTSGKH